MYLNKITEMILIDCSSKIKQLNHIYHAGLSFKQKQLNIVFTT